MPDITTARAILDRYNEAIFTKSAAALASVYADDAVHELPFMHGTPPMRGRQEVLERYTAGWAATNAKVKEIRNIVMHPAADGETFIIEEEIGVINMDTGVDFVAATVLVMRIADGKIAHIRDYTDNLTIARGLGRIPSLAD